MSESEIIPPAREKGEGLVTCDACPVLCRIRPGRTGACDRYGNVEGRLVRLDPVVLARRVADQGGGMVPFLGDAPWDGSLMRDGEMFVTGIGAGTTYPDYKPAPFIVSSKVEGVDTVTVVTEGIFSYCGVKVKIDTDRYVGPETAAVRAEGEQIGHVTTAEYGSQMLSLGGVRHLTGGSKKEGRVTCDSLLRLLNKEALEVEVEGGARAVIQAGRAPVINGRQEERMRVGCGSATIGIFARQWLGHVDEVVVVDDHITGVLTEHQAGRFLDLRPSGVRVRGRKSTPGRYFQVAQPGLGWGGTDITDPAGDPGEHRPEAGLAGDAAAVREHDRGGQRLLRAGRAAPAGAGRGAPGRTAGDRADRRELRARLVHGAVHGGAGGSLRAGVTENPVRLTRSVKDLLVRVTSGGAPVHVWPGGGITYMVDVTRMPDNSFGYVPTPAIVAPIEFTMRLDDYAALGGHMDMVRPLASVLPEPGRTRVIGLPKENPWPLRVPGGGQ